MIASPRWPLPDKGLLGSSLSEPRPREFLSLLQASAPSWCGFARRLWLFLRKLATGEKMGM